MKASQLTVNKQIIDENSEGQRIDNFLFKTLKGLPKSRVYRAIRKGEIRINGGRIKSDYKLQIGDEVRIPPLRVASQASQRLKPDDDLRQLLEQRILFENDEMIAINKPSGLPVHGGTKANSGVIEWLRMLRPQAKRLELVHRLDKDTSGVLLIAKKRLSLLGLQQQFADRSVDKSYLAIVTGKCTFEKKMVDQPLLRLNNDDGSRKVVISKQGKSALTEFRVLKRADNLTLLQAKILTGRMHQIRVHSSYLGLPIIGDQRYGDWKINRLCDKLGVSRMLLHAERLSLTLNNERYEFEAKPDDEFRSIFQYDKQLKAD